MFTECLILISDDSASALFFPFFSLFFSFFFLLFILFHFILFYFILFYFILFCFILFYFFTNDKQICHEIDGNRFENP